jgi:four helix bundle protein
MAVELYRDLVVWQKAMDLVVQVYRLTELFPRTEMYRLSDQLTRAVASVPANIAEGGARGSAKDYAHFLAIAKGSLVESETFLLIAVRLGYLAEEQSGEALALAAEVGKMLTVLRRRLLNRSAMRE